jgi:hypothetical protein
MQPQYLFNSYVVNLLVAKMYMITEQEDVSVTPNYLHLF